MPIGSFAPIADRACNQSTWSASASRKPFRSRGVATRARLERRQLGRKQPRLDLGAANVAAAADHRETG
jgi:hypothetical protein